MKGFPEKICPRCHYPKLKTWKELTDEERFLAERLPMSAEFFIEERQRHLFCPNCWLEIVDDSSDII